jgi:hypothetical protein
MAAKEAAVRVEGGLVVVVLRTGRGQAGGSDAGRS